MKLTVEREPFLKAASAALRAAGKANHIPILANLLLTPNGKSLEIGATDLTVQRQEALPADIEKGKSHEPITVVGEALVRIIEGLPKGAHISLQWDETSTTMSLQSGRSRYRLQTLPAPDFPDLAESAPKEPSKFTIKGEALVYLLGGCRPFMLRDVARPFLGGVFFHISDDDHGAFSGSRTEQLCCLTTSGVEFARLTAPLPEGASLPLDTGQRRGVILPDTAIPEIIKLATEAEELTILAGANRVSFEANGAIFTTGLIDARYPDYRIAIPPENDKCFTVDVDELAQVLRRLCSIGDDTRTRAEFSKRGLRLTLFNSRVGEADEFIEGEWDGDSIQLGLRGRGLLSILDVIDADTCVLRMSQPRRPIIVNPWIEKAIDHSRMFITMPVGF